MATKTSESSATTPGFRDQLSVRLTQRLICSAHRGYFAHLNSPSKIYSRADVEGELLPSIRRGSALMQACLLRELGSAPEKVAALLVKYYSNWPI